MADREAARARSPVADVRLARGRGPIHERVRIPGAGHDDFDDTIGERVVAWREKWDPIAERLLRKAA